ncbi:MAG: ATP-binding protein [Ignavibacteriaceae bacterium]|nr:ATP-binding protein [Ignavibacteriaceae bacterium]
MGTSKSKLKEKELLIKSRTENLTAVRDFISSAVREVDVPLDAAGDVVLAVDEACTNIIKHAYKYFPDGDITIKIKYSSKKIAVEITDHGAPFTPEAVPTPDLKKYFEEKRVGGLGMYLMKSLMDNVEYKSVPGRYNQVYLTKVFNSTN